MGFATRHNVPVHCNQWGVKDEVYDSNGRQQYARAMLNLFSEHKISSTYWLWRSYKKEGRDVTEPVWGFELTHNDGPHEALDEGMLSTLQEGFVKTARANSGNVYPCGAAAAGVDAGFEVAPLDGTAEAKALTLAQQPPVRFATPPLSTNSADSGVECDPLMLEMRIDWSLLEPSSSTGTPKRTVDWPAPPGMLPAGASTVAPPSPELPPPPSQPRPSVVPPPPSPSPPPPPPPSPIPPPPIPPLPAAPPTILHVHTTTPGPPPSPMATASALMANHEDRAAASTTTTATTSHVARGRVEVAIGLLLLTVAAGIAFLVRRRAATARSAVRPATTAERVLPSWARRWACKWTHTKVATVESSCASEKPPSCRGGAVPPPPPPSVIKKVNPAREKKRGGGGGVELEDERQRIAEAIVRSSRVDAAAAELD